MNSLLKLIACQVCKYPYPFDEFVFRCPQCGGIYDIETPPYYSENLIDRRFNGVWRYREIIGFPDDKSVITLEEGNTPLVWDDIDGRKVGFKLEYLNPTGSFKDRGSTVLVSMLHALGIVRAVEDSSGNAGASIAAYGSRAGIQVRIFVPASASGEKLAQIESYGAELISVPGTRSQVTDALFQEIGIGEVYASHVYQPFGMCGYATIAYELIEEMENVPGSVICPVGQGGLLLGLSLGFRSLFESGTISRMPEFIGVQAEPCAPLWHAYQSGGSDWNNTHEGETVAEGIRISKPIRGDKVLSTILASHGKIVAVAEGDILPGRDQLARRGFYVEPTSAVVWPAIMAMQDQLEEPVVVILTGAGYKYCPEE